VAHHKYWRSQGHRLFVAFGKTFSAGDLPYYIVGEDSDLFDDTHVLFDETGLFGG
jgi:hypothetical protein